MNGDVHLRALSGLLGLVAIEDGWVVDGGFHSLVTADLGRMVNRDVGGGGYEGGKVCNRGSWLQGGFFKNKGVRDLLLSLPLSFFFLWFLLFKKE